MMRSDHPIHVRRSLLILVTAMLGAAVSPFPQTPASASCAAPYLEVSRQLVLERGATLTIEGRAFVDGCQDVMGCSTGWGCDSCKYDDPPPTPIVDVGLRLVQRGRSWTLGEADAQTAETNDMGRVTWTFEVPAAAKPGPAQLLADQAEPVRIKIR